MKVECSVCAEQFDDQDPDWKTRKERHAEKHQRENANNSIGIVSWVRVWT